MRRRRLPSRRNRADTALVTHQATTDLRYLEQVVTIQFPVRAARAYLQRNMGNVVRYQLVEARRGETIGMVRAVEILHGGGGHRTWIYGERVLANGLPASFFVPDHLVQVRPVIEGAAARDKTLSANDEIVLYVPVRGYLRFLPEIYHGDGPVHTQTTALTRTTEVQRFLGSDMHQVNANDILVDEDPMRRFLFIFQHVMTTVTDRIDHIVDLTDPLVCEPKFLPWLASWVGFELDESLPVHQQRELVRRAIRLMRSRGTRSGIEEMVRVLTSAPVRVRERARPQPAALGQLTLIGGRDVTERYHRNEPPGVYLMEPTERRDTSFFQLMLEPRERFQKRFGERGTAILRRIVSVVSQERPTHVGFTVVFDERR